MASIVDTSVKHAYSSMAGAPAINGAAGSLISALDAFLVTGWGTKAVDSAVISNGVCRLNFASGKGSAEAHGVILVAGATPAALNGEQKVTTVANGWVDFKTALPDGAVTGSISFKMAPLGWEKVFTGTNKAVYRQTDPASTRTYYRVDDSNALYARVQMYESMTDVDTGVAAAPLTVAGGYYWHKRVSAGGNGNYWMLAGDSRGFFAVLFPHSSTTFASGNNFAGCSYYAGDLNSYRSGDAWGAVLTGVTTTSWNDQQGCVFFFHGFTGMSLKRRSTGIGGAVQTQRRMLGATGGTSGMDPYFGAFPSRVDNSLRLTRLLMTDSPVDLEPRGEMPGAYYCPQTSVLVGFGWDVALTKGQGEFLGKHLLSLHIGGVGSQNQGLAFFDVTGPWRPQA